MAPMALGGGANGVGRAAASRAWSSLHAGRAAAPARTRPIDAESSCASIAHCSGVMGCALPRRAAWTTLDHPGPGWPGWTTLGALIARTTIGVPRTDTRGFLFPLWLGFLFPTPAVSYLGFLCALSGPWTLVLYGR